MMRANTVRILSILATGFCILLFSLQAYADDEIGVSRIVDIPDIENASSTLSDEFREIFTDLGHLVYNEKEMLDGASAIGVHHEQYWKEVELLKKVNKRLRHEGLIVVKREKGSRRDSLIIDVYNAFDGSQLAGFELGLKRRGKLSGKEKSKLRNAIHPLLIDINPSLYPTIISISVDSTPQGASILRNGMELGKTPYTYEVDSNPTATEQWFISLDGHESKPIDVEFKTDQHFNLSFTEEVEDSSESSFVGKVRHGRARPVLKIGANIDVGIRSLDSEVKNWTPISYTTQAHPIVGLDLEFFPFGLAADNQYLANLGMFFNFGVGFLSDRLQFTPADENSTSCKNNDDGTYSCDTLFSRFQLGAIYRLLLQKSNDKLDPHGMAIAFSMGYNWSLMDISRNPLYRGHSYQGMLIGVEYSTHLGHRPLRADIGLDFIYNVGFGNAQMIGTWGTAIDNSWGIAADLSLSYDFWKGIYAALGYKLSHHRTKYKGEGCMNAACNLPTNSKTMDTYHEIIIGFGWKMY
ncbi:MAG: PEGA domain-containing protein [Bradymonadales bacterium]